MLRYSYYNKPEVAREHQRGILYLNKRTNSTWKWNKIKQNKTKETENIWTCWYIVAIRLPLYMLKNDNTTEEED